MLSYYNVYFTITQPWQVKVVQYTRNNNTQQLYIDYKELVKYKTNIHPPPSQIIWYVSMFSHTGGQI